MNNFYNKTVKSVSAIAIAYALLFSESAHAINCRITVGPISFGTYMPLTPSHVDVVGQFNVRCQAQPGSFSVTIGPGISGNQMARTLSAGGAEILYYNLFRDAARTEIWGDGTPPTFVVNGMRPSQGRPTFYNYPVYGRIFSSQAPNPGVYNDNLLVTVLF